MKFIYLILTAALFVYGCSSEKSKDEQAIKDVIYKNIEAGNNEDVDTYISTMDKDYRNYDRLEEMMNTIFRTYDLKYQVKDIKVIELKDNEAKVQFVQITKKVEGPRFRDNRIEGIHTLHKTDGQWKIFDTQITKMDYLN
jgi:PBP1b-binding outer membrane lipoprotein LpoB